MVVICFLPGSSISVSLVPGNKDSEILVSAGQVAFHLVDILSKGWFLDNVCTIKQCLSSVIISEFFMSRKDQEKKDYSCLHWNIKVS